ncbi:MAG: hypothetical protein ABJH52_11160 [Henriciella sp.]
MFVSNENDGSKDLGAPSDMRSLKRIAIGDTSIHVEVMVYREDTGTRQPLVIVNSIDLPMPPSSAFCEQMWNAGYQVIFVRRPGFGNTANLPPVLLESQEVKSLAPLGAETAVLKILIETMNLKNIVLMGMGTSNSICLRVAQLSTEVEFSIYANPLFHPAIWEVVRPAWLRRMIRQTLLSKSGLKIGVRGLRAVLRRDPIWFYKQFAQKSFGDVAYVCDNLADFRQAGILLQNYSPELMYYELQTALIEDTRWPSKATRNSNAVILSGTETTKNWKRKITAEAKRLGLPIVFAPSGDLFVAYASADVLCRILDDRRPGREGQVANSQDQVQTLPRSRH